MTVNHVANGSTRTLHDELREVLSLCASARVDDDGNIEARLRARIDRLLCRFLLGPGAPCPDWMDAEAVRALREENHRAVRRMILERLAARGHSDSMLALLVDG